MAEKGDLRQREFGHADSLGDDKPAVTHLSDSGSNGNDVEGGATGEKIIVGDQVLRDPDAGMSEEDRKHVVRTRACTDFLAQ